MTHLTEEDLILIYYGEPDRPPDGAAHLNECARCREAANALNLTLDLCNQFSVPDQPVEFERGVWAGLAPLLPASRRRWALPRFWMALAGAAVLLLFAFALGRRSRTPPPSVATGMSSEARQRILEISLADHLDSAGMLLTEISNTGEFERSRAENLAEQGRLLHQTLARDGDSSTLTFLDDVDRLLTEAAHAADPRELKERIHSQSLLFKVRIIESNLRKQGQQS